MAVNVPAETFPFEQNKAVRSKSRGPEGGFKPYPVDTSVELASLLDRFARDQQPAAISFRKLVHWLKVGERASHYLHPYPAKLLPHIAHFFLANRVLVGADEFVLDPFAGSGTVALETILSGRRALYADANPLGRLITAVKTRSIDPELLAARAVVRDGFRRSRAWKRPDVINLEKWFDPNVISELIRLRAAISTLDDGPLRDFMRVTFSAVTRKVSNSDPRFSVPVRYREGEMRNQISAADLFEAQLEANIARIATLGQVTALGTATPAGVDARHLSTALGERLPDHSVGMIISSPPYASAQKYVRAASLSLGWLDLAPSNGLRQLEHQTIGREHHAKATWADVSSTGIDHADALIAKIAKENASRAKIFNTYLIEMRVALAEAVRVLRPGGCFVLVIGDNTVCGRRFASSEYLRLMLEGMGMTTILSLVDPIPSRGLMTRRNETAGIITSESVIVLRKVN
jgi:SAM-dependent methyltransferase